MQAKKIYAIIISYNGEREILNTVKSVFNQVDKVIIVDNGSNAVTLNNLAELQVQEKLRVVYLDDNYGIAYAQNVGIAVAEKEGAHWVLTMDQDSLCAEDMVWNLIDTAEKYEQSKLGFCCPVINHKTIDRDEARGSGIEYINYAISSGCLFPMKTLQKAGKQRDEYFIDSVDFEYCLRLMTHGYKMVRVKSAILNHNLGLKKKIRSFIGDFWIFVHTPVRRYYIFRNHIFLIKSYWRSAPLFLMKKTLFLVLLLLQIVFFENNKISNIKHCYRGVVDGLMNRSGKISTTL